MAGRGGGGGGCEACGRRSDRAEERGAGGWTPHARAEEHRGGRLAAEAEECEGLFLLDV